MIQFQNASVKYGDRNALKNVDFTLEDHSNLSIIGPNGSGKTTLLKSIANLLPFSGEISIDGQSIRKLKQPEFSKMVSMMSQSSSVYFSYSVYETVMMGRYAHGRKGLFNTPSRHDVERVEECLKKVGLTSLKDRSIHELSGGQLQRVFLARTMAQNAKIILLDEPTNHLDLKHQVEIIDYLKDWSKEGNRTVIGVFHDINLAKRFSENVMVVAQGEIAGYGQIGREVTQQLLEDVYQLDVVQYMKQSFDDWNRL